MAACHRQFNGMGARSTEPVRSKAVRGLIVGRETGSTAIDRPPASTDQDEKAKTIAQSTRLPGSQDLPELSPPPSLVEMADWSLFLDFDGTLVEIAERPQDVVVSQGLPAALEALSRRLAGRLAIVSGRSLAALNQMLGPISVAMAGSHGGEFRPAGSDRIEALADPLPKALCEALATFAQDNGGLVFEAKPCSAAVHYRDRPQIGPALFDHAQRLATDFGAYVKHGKMVVELTMPGSDKGNAVSRFMGLPPFAGSRPLFVGDDVTDEDAFAAVRRFDGGGVLVGSMRETRALWRLSGVAAVHDWLEKDA
jgi:trehalose 6-phosphate phosphatase